VRMSTNSHAPFALVLAGGGARGYAHVGVLRALEVEGVMVKRKRDANKKFTVNKRFDNNWK